MENTFNPTKKDLITIEKLILDIKSKKNQLVSRKMNLQNSLTHIKEKYKNFNHESKEYQKANNTKNNLKQHLNEIELKIKTLNQELIFKNKLKLEVEFFLKNNKILENSEDFDKLKNKLNSLKLKYNNFAKDKTRISSLRIMALEFVDELNEII